MATKRGRLSLLGEAVILELQEQARYERAMARFSPDDDIPRVPEVDPMASAQAKRAQRLEVVA